MGPWGRAPRSTARRGPGTLHRPHHTRYDPTKYVKYSGQILSTYSSPHDMSQNKSLIRETHHKA